MISMENYVVWLCEASKIASFHFVDGFSKMNFITHEFFLNYLQELQIQGYRFQ